MEDAGPRQRIQLAFADPVMAAEARAWLEANGGQDIETRELQGILPVALPIIVGAAIAAGAVAGIVAFLRQKFACLLVVDAREATPKISTDCSDRNGRTILIAPKDVQIELSDVPPVFDFTAVAKAAIEGGADAVKSAAEAAGAGAEVLAGGDKIPARV